MFVDLPCSKCIFSNVIYQPRIILTFCFESRSPLVVSVYHQHNLTLVSNLRKAVPKSLFWALNGLNNLTEMCFEFPCNPIGKATMAFLTGQSWRALKSWYTGGASNKDFGITSQTDLTRVKFCLLRRLLGSKAVHCPKLVFKQNT